jgi:DNA processing protein
VIDHDLTLAALVAVLSRRAPTGEERRQLSGRRGAPEVLDARHGLFASCELERGEQLLAEWSNRGILVISEHDARYPANLTAAGDRPPALFMRGSLEPDDGCSVAVVGTRRPTEGGVTAARALASALVYAGYTVVSGLASGIDTAAHVASLAAGGRTLAVLGTGVDRCYPPENAALQHEIASRCAVLSPFAPGAPPTRRSFPVRNSVTSGLALATVIVEASATSGTRIQARASLAQGRPVVLLADVLEQDWAVQLAAEEGVHVVDRATDVLALLRSLGLGERSGDGAAAEPTPEHQVI